MASELHDHDRVGLAQAAHQLLLRQRAWDRGEHVVALGDRHAGRRPAARHAGDAGDDFRRIGRRKPYVEVHVGAIEQRVPLADHGDAATGIEMRRDRRRGGVVEFAHGVAVERVVLLDFSGQRIEQRQLFDPRPQLARDDGASIAAVAALGEVRDDVGFLERAHRLEREELWIAGPNTDPNEPPAAHISSLASALTAAAAMALPPMRPRTIRNGTPRGSAASASLDSAAPTKPTGTPMIAAGGGAPASSISMRRNSAVGALPMATRASASRSGHSSSAAAERVLPRCSASVGTRASRRVETTALCAGNRARVMPCATISASHRIGAPRSSAARAADTKAPPKTICSAAATRPQEWIIRTTISASFSEKRNRLASARMIAKERS